MEQIHRLRAGAPTAVLLTGYWNVFEDGDVARRAMTKQGLAESDTLTRATNQVIEQVAGDQQATYVDLYTAFKGADGGRSHAAARRRRRPPERRRPPVDRSGADGGQRSLTGPMIPGCRG